MLPGLKARLKKAPRLFSSVKVSYYWTLRIAERLCGSRIHEWIWKSKAHALTTNYESTLDHPHRAHLIDALMTFAPFNSALEIGCNSAPNLLLLSQRAPHSALYGIDINADAIERGRELLAKKGAANVSLSIDKMENLRSWPDQSVDVLFTDAVLLYVGRDKIDRTFSEMKRVARKGLLFNEWNLPASTSHGYPSKWYYFHWIHDYRTLLSKHFPSDLIRVEKLPPGLWGGDHGWKEFGATVTVRIQTHDVGSRRP